MKKGLFDFMEKDKAEVFCFQEVKAKIEQIPEGAPKEYYFYLMAIKKGIAKAMNKQGIMYENDNKKDIAENCKTSEVTVTNTYCQMIKFKKYLLPIEKK